MADVEVIVLSDTDDEEGPSCQNRTQKNHPSASASSSSKPSFVGLHRNPSGQTTLAFDSRLKTRRPDRPSHYCANKSLTTPITAHFKSKDPEQEMLKISITEGQSKRGSKRTEVKIVLQDDREHRNPLLRTTARKTMRSFVPKMLPVAGDTSEPEVVCLSDDDGQAKEDSMQSFAGKRARPEETSSPGEGAAPKKMKLENLSLVRVAISDVLTTCEKFLPTHEHAKIAKKFHKKLETIPENILSSEQLSYFVEETRQKIVGDRGKTFIYIKRLLDELVRCSVKVESGGEKKYAELLKVECVGVLSRSTEPVKLECAEGSSGSAHLQPKHATGEGTKMHERGTAKTKKSASSGHIRRLEEALRQCQENIKKLAVAEVDFEKEEDDTTYIKECQYKRKCVQIYKKLSELTGGNTSLGSRQEKKFKFRGSRILEINVKVEKFIRKKKAKEPDFFPDFADILELYKATNEKKELCMSKEILLHEAKETFCAIGKELKSRREFDFFDAFQSYLPEETDQVEEDDELSYKLEENFKVAKKNTDHVFDEFSRREIEVGEVAEEVPDDEPFDEAEKEHEGDDDEKYEPESDDNANKDNDSTQDSEEEHELSLKKGNKESHLKHELQLNAEFVKCDSPSSNNGEDTMPEESSDD